MGGVGLVSASAPGVGMLVWCARVGMTTKSQTPGCAGPRWPLDWPVIAPNFTEIKQQSHPEHGP